MADRRGGNEAPAARWHDALAVIGPIGRYLEEAALVAPPFVAKLRLGGAELRDPLVSAA